MSRADKKGREIMAEDKEKEKMVGVTLPESLIEKIQEEAWKKERSLSAQIRYILKLWSIENENQGG
jgi:hypothetical protein